MKGRVGCGIFRVMFWMFVWDVCGDCMFFDEFGCFWGLRWIWMFF